MSKKAKSAQRKVVGPVGRAIVARVQRKRSDHLRDTGEDLLWSEIGRQMGWKEPTTSSIRNLTRSIHLEEVPRLAKVLGVAEAILFCGENAVVEAYKTAVLAASTAAKDTLQDLATPVDPDARDREENQPQDAKEGQLRRAHGAGGVSKSSRIVRRPREK